MKKYSKIGQFRDVIKEIYSYFNHHEIPLGNLKFYGKVKLHGTNAGIGYSPNRGLWTQKRNGLCTVQNDNYGFAAYVEKNKEFYTALLKEFHAFYSLKKDEKVLFFWRMGWSRNSKRSCY